MVKLRGALRRIISKAKVKAEDRIVEARLKKGSLKRAALAKAASGTKRGAGLAKRGAISVISFEERQKIRERARRPEKFVFGKEGFKGRLKKKSRPPRRKQEVIVRVVAGAEVPKPEKKEKGLLFG